MLHWVGKGWTRQMCIGGETGGSSRDRGRKEEKKKREERGGIVKRNVEKGGNKEGCMCKRI